MLPSLTLVTPTGLESLAAIRVVTVRKARRDRAGPKSILRMTVQKLNSPTFSFVITELPMKTWPFL